jgi:hypothetical protein
MLFFEYMNVSPKSPAKSKTVWTGLILGILSSIPQVQDFIRENPEITGILNSAVIIGLRYFTKEPLKWNG